MTKLLFTQLKSDSRYHVTPRAWYRNYTYRIKFAGDNLFERLHINKYATLLIQNQHPYKSRWGGHNFCIYLQTPEAVSDLLNSFGDAVIEIMGPATPSHASLLVNDETTILRDRLYYGEFRYKISMMKYRRDMEVFGEVHDFILDSFDANIYRCNSALRSYRRLNEIDSANVGRSLSSMRHWPVLPWRATGTVYLKNYDDVCMLHLMYKEHIDSSTKIILIEEL